MWGVSEFFNFLLFTGHAYALLVQDLYKITGLCLLAA